MSVTVETMDEISPSEMPRPVSKSVSELDRPVRSPTARSRALSTAPKLTGMSSFTSPRKRSWTFRKIKSLPEFDPSSLADFRVTEWDPTRLLMALYRTDNSHFHRARLRKEGTLDALNLGQTKPGIFRRYRTKYLLVSDSTVLCYQHQPADRASKPKISVTLPVTDAGESGGSDEGDLMDHVRWHEGSPVVQVRDTRTQKWFSCRATSGEEAAEWFDTIRQEMANPGFVKSPLSLFYEARPDALVDLVVLVGSTSVRAGFSENKEGGPLLFFPSVLLQDETADVNAEFSWGYQALPPSTRRRATSRLSHGFRYSQSLQENAFRPLHLSSLLCYILSDLLRLTNRARIRLLLSLPHAWKSNSEDVCHVVLGELGLNSLAMIPAHLLSLYHDPSSLTALVVRVGGGTEVVPVVEGSVLESAAVRNPELGGHLVDAMLSDLLARRGVRSSSLVEDFLWRLVKERHAFVAPDPAQETGAEGLEVEVDLTEFDPPNPSHGRFTIQSERWECAEVLFNPNLLGKDFPSLQDCIAQVLNRVDVDLRRPLAKNILLVGGTSKLRGLPERLHKELTAKLIQQGDRRGFQIGIKTLPDREHAGFLGGCHLLRDQTFSGLMSREWIELSEWIKEQEIHV